MSLLDYVNPFRLYREHIIKPVQAFVYRQYFGYKKRTDAGISSAKELLYRAGIVTVFLTAILWISIFMYVIFYYTYMPNVTHVRPVHLQFKSCEEQMGICSFPSAHVQLTKKSHMLMSAQPYRIKLTLEMPESQVNKDLGMFMVCAQMRAKRGVLVSASCRSAMLRYRSRLHRLLRTLVFSPLLLAGLEEEKQTLHVDLFSDFEDDQNVPVTDAYVEVQSRFAQVYSCELHIQAHFTGLRHVMFHWPNLAALIGISTNLFFVSLIFILSWYHLQDGLPDFVKNKFKSEVKDETDDKFGKVKLEREGISTNLFFVSLIFILSWYHLQDGLPDFVKNKFKSEVKDETDDKFGKVKLEREGISTNLFFVSLIFILSWYHLQDGLPDFVKNKFKSEVKDETDDKFGKVKLEREDSSSFFEGDTLLEEFRQIEEAQKT